MSTLVYLYFQVDAKGEELHAHLQIMKFKHDITFEWSDVLMTSCEMILVYKAT